MKERCSICFGGQRGLSRRGGTTQMLVWTLYVLGSVLSLASCATLVWGAAGQSS